MLYIFLLRDHDGTCLEDNGPLHFETDLAAKDFGESMVRDILVGSEGRYVGWTLEVANGARVVCSLPFSG